MYLSAGMMNSRQKRLYYGRTCSALIWIPQSGIMGMVCNIKNGFVFVLTWDHIE